MGTVVNIPAARMFFAPAVSMACFASSSPNQWRRSNHLGLKAGPARHHYRDAGSRHDRVRPEVRRLKVRCGSWAPMSRGPANGGYGVEPRRPFTAAGMTGFGAFLSSPRVAAKVPFNDPLQTSILMHCLKLEFVGARPGKPPCGKTSGMLPALYRGSRGVTRPS